MSRAVVVACALFVVVLLVIPGCGTLEQRIVVTSDPPGALVYANDEELGRTPFQRDFVWYGKYDVEVRADGYETKHARTKVYTPWWLWPPLDLFVQILPLHAKDVRRLHYRLKPMDQQAADPELMLSRAEQLRIRLESSPFTRNPATMPATQPATTQSTQPATTTTSPSSTEPATAPATTAPATTKPSTTPATRPGSFL